MQRKNFENPYLGITLDDFKDRPKTHAERFELELKEAKEKGESLAYLRIDGDFYYDGKYYSADHIIPKVHWLNAKLDNQRKLWIAVIYNLPYGEKLDAEFDFEKIEEPNFGPMKPVLLSELNDKELQYEKSYRDEYLSGPGNGKKMDEQWQQLKEKVLRDLLANIPKH